MENKKAPRKTEVAYVRLPKKTKNYLVAEAKRQKMHFSDLVGELITNQRDGLPYITHQERREMRKAEKAARAKAEAEAECA